jgi:hypothetical protein
MGVTMKIAETELARCVTLPILIKLKRKKPMRNFAAATTRF